MAGLRELVELGVTRRPRQEYVIADFLLALHLPWLWDRFHARRPRLAGWIALGQTLVNGRLRVRLESTCTNDSAICLSHANWKKVGLADGTGSAVDLSAEDEGENWLFPFSAGCNRTTLAVPLSASSLP